MAESNDPMTPGQDGTQTHIPHEGNAEAIPTVPFAEGTTKPLSLPRNPTVSLRYRPIRLHAQGGLGEVYIAEDSELGRTVALKSLRPHAAASAVARQRFIREAEITARLQHPNVAAVYGLVYDPDGQPLYAMQFIEGETLQSAINRFHGGEPISYSPGKSRLLLSNLLWHFITVCRVMAYAHSRGVIHRDLKPDNVMIGPFGETLVVDWGLAKVIDETPSDKLEAEPQADRATLADPITRAGGLLGTPAFMSPEQAAGLEVGPLSDVYSLGVILYMLLSGRRPFDAAEVRALLEEIQAGRFVPLRKRNSTIPPALECICLKAMAVSPGDRYSTVGHLEADVMLWLADQPVSVYRSSLGSRLRRWERRYQWTMPRVMFWLTGGVAVFFFVLLVVVDSRRQTRIEKLERELHEARSHAK